MAIRTKTRKIPAGNVPKPPKRGRKPTYYWDKWFANDEPFDLVKGVHYNCLTYGFTQQIRNRASERGIRVKLNVINDNTIRVQVIRY